MSEVPDFGALLSVHHLNCGSFHPTKSLSLVTHVLACEFESGGVVLVDTGIGQIDIQNRKRRLGTSLAGTRPALRMSETAAHQLADLGLDQRVELIVATHLDVDHIGGAADFPSASVAVCAEELESARRKRTVREKIRYRTPHLHDIRARVKPIDTSSPHLTELAIGLHGVRMEASGTVWLVPMPGHTRGHAAVALNLGDGWLVHAGDAYFDRRSIALGPTEPPSSLLMRAEKLLAIQPKAVASNHKTLHQLAAQGVQVICSHDPADM
ncbi:MBL fold metallo-hydrolase [Gordonia sputi]